MPRLSEIARVTSRDMSGSATDIRGMAQLVHARMVVEAKKRPVPMQSREEGILGYQWRGAVSQIVSSVFPETNLLPENERDDLNRVLRDYLKQSRNADCLVKRDRSHRPYLPIWWVNAVWNPIEVFLTHRHARRDDAIDRRAAKLTPEEAGETRDPMPVETRMKNDETTEGSSVSAEPAGELSPRSAAGASNYHSNEKIKKAFEETRLRKTEEHQAYVACVYGLLTETNQPLVVQEIAADLGSHETSARNALNELREAGKVFCRVETPEERRIRAGGVLKAKRAELWSAQSPVPARTLRQAVSSYIQEPSPVPVSKVGVRNGMIDYMKRGKPVKNASDVVQHARTFHSISVDTGYEIIDQLVATGVAVESRDESPTGRNRRQITLTARLGELPVVGRVPAAKPASQPSPPRPKDAPVTPPQVQTSDAEPSIRELVDQAVAGFRDSLETIITVASNLGASNPGQEARIKELEAKLEHRTQQLRRLTED